MNQVEKPQPDGGERLMTFAEYERLRAEKGGELPDEGEEPPEVAPSETKTEHDEAWAQSVLEEKFPGSPFRLNDHKRGKGGLEYWDFTKEDEPVSPFKPAPRYRVLEDGSIKALF
ncbi:MAG: hypothetical protein AAB495_03770 [Patescibacteria group bacterium]